MDKQLSYCNVWLPLLEFYSGHMYNNDKKQTDSFMIPKKNETTYLEKSENRRTETGMLFFFKTVSAASVIL